MITDILNFIKREVVVLKRVSRSAWCVKSEMLKGISTWKTSTFWAVCPDAWKEDRHTLCNHLIPTEIAQQIATKIELGEPFKCYLVIPMYPEGDTATKPSQEILFLAI
jgi:hypothetical protein